MKYKTVKLKEIADIVMGQSPKSDFYNTDGMGTPFLQGVRTFGDNYPIIDTYTTLFNREASAGQILFSVRAPVGRVNWATQNIAIGRGLAAIKVKSGYSKDYLYYLFKRIGSRLDSLSTGTVFTSINKKELEELSLNIPIELTNQERIANYLKRLDLKIDLNNQINANLTKLRNLQYRQLIDSNTVRKVKITELFNIFYGKSLPKSKLINSGIQVFGANGLMGYTSEPSIIEKPTVTITSRGSGSGYVSYLDVGKAFLTNNLLYLDDKNNLGLSFVFEAIKASNPNQFVTGSAQPQLTIKNLSRLDITAPVDRDVIDEFRKEMHPIESTMRNNNLENYELKKLKDTLLCKYFK